MCGRYKMSKPVHTLVEQFHVDVSYDPPARYNIAPTDAVPAIRLDDDGKRVLLPLRWGLIPFWAKDPRIGSKMINARAETLAEKPPFKEALEKRRCLVLADGFYEWRREGKEKQPFLFQLRSRASFAFAGLWAKWKGPDGPVESCTIVTTTANELLAAAHDRMPVILDAEDHGRWLARGAAANDVIELLRPYDAVLMDATPVSPRVGSVRNDDPSCAEPLEPLRLL